MAMVYDLPQVSPTARPMTPVTAPEYHNYAPEQGQAMSKAMLQASEAALKIKEMVDTGEAKKADNQLSDTLNPLLHDPDNGFLNKGGKDAIDNRAKAVEAINKAASDAFDGLGNDQQKAMFEQAKRARVQQALQQVDAHFVQQTKVFNMGESEARIKNLSRDTIAAHNAGDMESYKKNRGAAINEAAEYAKLNNYGAEKAKEFRLATTSTIATNVIDGLVKSNPKAALAYYEENKADINAELHDSIKAKIDNGIAYVDGTADGDKIYDKYAPKNFSGSIETATAKMLKDAKDKGGSKEYQHYLAATIEGRVKQFKLQETGAAEAASNSLHTYMEGKGSYQGALNLIKNEEVTGKINSTRAAALRAHARTHYKVDEKNAEAKMAKRFEEIAKGMDFLQRMMAGQEGSVTPQDVYRKKASEFGHATPMVAKGVEAINQNLANPKLTYAAFDRKLSLMGEKVLGFDPNSKDQDNKNRKMAMFMLTIDTMAKEGAKGAGHQQPTLESLILNTIKEERVSDGYTVFGVHVPFTDKKVKAYQVYDLPDSEKKAIVIGKIKKAGRVPTPEAIANGMRELNKKSDRGLYHNNKYNPSDEGE